MTPSPQLTTSALTKRLLVLIVVALACFALLPAMQAPIPSSARFKDEIKPMDKASEAILALKPVTFRYKKGLDPDGMPQFGLVAEDVAKVNPDLVVRDDKEQIYTVRYDAVNAMLLNEFLKEHQKVEEQGRELQYQEAINAELLSALAAVNARLKQQDAKIEQVNARVELAKPQPQLVDARFQQPASQSVADQLSDRMQFQLRQ